jgi:hypothetical protein
VPRAAAPPKPTKPKEVALVRHRILLVVVTCLALLLPAVAAQANRTQFTTVEAPSELLFSGSPDAALDQIRDLGATAIRLQISWNSVAPDPDAKRAPSFNATDPNAYPAGAWGRYDAAIDGARARGLKVYLTLTGPAPRWATAAKKDNLTKPSAEAFSKFASAAGRRYGSKVSWWSIWNEPNLGKLLKPIKRLASATVYRQLYLQAYSGLRGVGVRAPILLGELAPIGNTYRDQGTIHPLQFLRKVLCLDSRWHKSGKCGKVPTQGFAMHPYTTKFGPFFHPLNQDDVTIGVLSRLVKGLDRAASAGALPRRLPVYVSEFGVQSYPDRLFGVPLPTQSDFRSIGEQMAWGNARVKSFSQYLLRDDPPSEGAHGKFESGLFLYADGAPKPSYYGFRLPLVVTKKSHGRVALWGFVRPAHGRAGSLEIQVKDHSGGWKKLATQRYPGSGYWQRGAAAKAGRQWRVVWTDAATGTQWAGSATVAR